MKKILIVGMLCVGMSASADECIKCEEAAVIKASEYILKELNEKR